MSVVKLNNFKIEFKDSPENHLLAEIYIDDQPIVNSKYVVDLDELEKSVDYHGKFFILTCESNEPEHIEISKGINVHKDDADFVHWRFSAPAPDKAFVFNADDYRSSVLKAVDNWRALVSDREENKKLSYQEIHSYVKYQDDSVEEEDEESSKLSV